MRCLFAVWILACCLDVASGGRLSHVLKNRELAAQTAMLRQHNGASPVDRLRPTGKVADRWSGGAIAEDRFNLHTDKMPDLGFKVRLRGGSATAD
eukprot:3578132-Rhodomonas_salina.1